MNDNQMLRAADSLFSPETLTSFIYVLAFLICYDRLEKYIIGLGLRRWLTRLITSCITFCLLIISFIGLKYCSLYVYKLRFNPSSIDTQFPPSDLGYWSGVFMGMIGCSLIFTSYKYLSKNLSKKIDSFTQRAILDGLIVFIFCNLFFLTANTILNGSISVAFPQLSIYVSGTAGCALAIIIYNYHKYLSNFKAQEKELKIVRLQQEVAQSQLDALSSKINPHFLYNALNSIAGLSTTDGLKTRDMAIALSKLFRYNINKEESNYATIAQEMEMVQVYLEIEKIRFEETLQYNISIPTEIELELIPKHLLQPLVENAVKHGAGPNGITINISIKKDEKQIIICVGDNGKPFDTDFNPGYGIKSLYDKLDLLTSGHYEIAFLTQPKQVQITLGEYSKLTQ